MVKERVEMNRAVINQWNYWTDRATEQLRIPKNAQRIDTLSNNDPRIVWYASALLSWLRPTGKFLDEEKVTASQRRYDNKDMEGSQDYFWTDPPVETCVQNIFV